MFARTVIGRTNTSLAAILILTFLASLSTGVLWSGISFIAKHDYGYSQERNFLLYIVTAVTYVIAAFSAGWLTRRVARWMSPRGVIAALLMMQIIVSPFPIVFEGEWSLWFVACMTSIISALLWPVVESYLSAGRHGQSMRSAIGWWNISWTSAVAASMLLMAPLLDEQVARLAIVGLAPASVLAMMALPWFARQPSEHDESQWRASITFEYPELLRSVRVLLPLSYLVIGAVSPLMPYRLEELEVRTITETPATSTWMIVRVFAIILMWRLRFWHGRWGALLLGATGMVIGFAFIALSPSIQLVLFGLGLLGAGQGVIYYAALYYAMSVGRAEVDAGGTHEALIGVGYTAGPLAALIGIRLPVLPGVAAAGGGGIVTAVVAAFGLACIPAVRPYFRARKLRTAMKPEGDEPRSPNENLRNPPV